MHKRSEYLLVIIGIILFVVIALLSLVYELSNKEIDHHNTEITKQFVLLSTVQNRLANERNDLDDVQFQIVFNIPIIKELFNRVDYADDEIYNIRRAYYNSSINQSEFNSLEYDYHHRKANEYLKQFNIENEKSHSLANQQLSCWHVRCDYLSSVSNWLRLVLFFIALGLYIFLFKIMQDESIKNIQ